MKNGVALSLARNYARSKTADLALMALSVGLAVFVSASVAGAASSFNRDMKAREADPSYLEITAVPSAFADRRAQAVEVLETGNSRGFFLQGNVAEDAKAESPSVAYIYSYTVDTFTIGEAPSRGGFPGEPAAMAARTAPGSSGRPAGDSAGASEPAMPADAPFPGAPPDFMARVQPTEAELAEAARLETPLLEVVAGARVDPAFFGAYGFQAAEGSLFTQDEALAGRASLVLGSTLAGRLYADGVSMGKRIRLEGITYDIVGVLKPIATIGDVDWNDMAFSPFRNIRAGANGAIVRFGGMGMNFAASSADAIDSAVKELSAYFDRTVGSGLITIQSQKAELQERRHSQSTLLAIAVSLSALCVMVAMLNLMNATAARTLKRRRSLGILRAIGATRMDVSAAAFWESAFSAIGGLVTGSTAAFAFKNATSLLLTAGSSARGSSFMAMAAASLLAAAIPLVLGALPAWSAVRVPPAELVRPE